MLKNARRNEIFIFSDDEDPDEFILLRNFLKKNGIRQIILVSLEDISQKLIDSNIAKIVVEEVFLLERNPKKIPIIFYGGRRDDYLVFIKSCNWYDRKDMGWVENPYAIETLTELVEEIEIHFKL